MNEKNYWKIANYVTCDEMKELFMFFLQAKRNGKQQLIEGKTENNNRCILIIQFQDINRSANPLDIQLV